MKLLCAYSWSDDWSDLINGIDRPKRLPNYWCVCVEQSISISKSVYRVRGGVYLKRVCEAPVIKAKAKKEMKKYHWMSARIFKYEIRNVFEKCALLDIPYICIVYMACRWGGRVCQPWVRVWVSAGDVLTWPRSKSRTGVAGDWPNILWNPLCIAVHEHAHPRSK